MALPALWLRERSQSPDAARPGHRSTPLRPASPAGRPRARRRTARRRRAGGRLLGRPPRGVRGAGAARLPRLRRQLPATTPVAVATSDVRPRHDWSALDADAGLRAALHDLIVFGVVVIDGAPTEPGTVLEVAGRFGYVRETNFGRLFDVRTVPGSNDLAYRAVASAPTPTTPTATPGARHPAAALPGQRDDRRPGPRWSTRWPSPISWPSTTRRRSGSCAPSRSRSASVTPTRSW